MDEGTKAEIKKQFNAHEIVHKELIQELWSSYGKIDSYQLKSEDQKTIIVKNIDLSRINKHPRGWSTHFSHQRKLSSYQNEMIWYREWSKELKGTVRLPAHYYSEQNEKRITLVMEDLDASGFSARIDIPTYEEIKLVLSYLAKFHAYFMHRNPKGLWKEGTYWHLTTRPDEWDQMEDGDLKDRAEWIADRLKGAKYQTIIHGDAKLANFCFSVDSKQIAAVDFQYVGGGCGMKDVAYFLSSCSNTELWQPNEDELLRHYFQELKAALLSYHPEVEWTELEKEWRALYPFAWADFIRFLKGWSPEHWKIDKHGEEMVEQIIYHF